MGGVQTLDHDKQWVGAAKYSPKGDRIATATEKSVRVWDSDDGRLLVHVEVRPFHGLLWFDNHLFVTTKDNKIRRIDASTGLTVSEWTVPGTRLPSSIALPQHGRFIAYSTRDNVSLWDTSTHTQLGLIPQSSGMRSIAFSPDDRFDIHAIVAQEQKIIVRDHSPVDLASIVVRPLTNTFPLLTYSLISGIRNSYRQRCAYCVETGSTHKR